MSRPKAPSNAGQTFSVGFVLFVATCIVVGGLFWVGSGDGLFHRRATYYADLPSSSGIIVGSKVKLSGVDVGSVTDIEFAKDLELGSVRVTLDVRDSVTELIREDSKLWLEPDGLLGDYFVYISLGTPTSPELRPGSEIPVTESSLIDRMAGANLTSNTEALLGTMSRVLEEIQAGQGTIGLLLKNPSLYEDLGAALKSFRELGDELDGVTQEIRGVVGMVRSQRGLLGKVLFAEEYEAKIAAAIDQSVQLISSVDSIASSLGRGEGSMGKLLSDDTLHRNAVEAIGELSGTAKEIASIIGTAKQERSVAGRLLADGDLGRDVSELAKSLRSSAESLEKVLAMVESGDGTLGMLVHDPSIATSVRNVFYGVQDMGYVRGLIASAEDIGREVARSRDFTSSGARETDAVGRAASGTASEGDAEPRRAANGDGGPSSEDRTSIRSGTVDRED